MNGKTYEDYLKDYKAYIDEEIKKGHIYVQQMENYIQEEVIADFHHDVHLCEDKESIGALRACLYRAMDYLTCNDRNKIYHTEIETETIKVHDELRGVYDDTFYYRYGDGRFEDDPEDARQYGYDE